MFYTRFYWLIEETRKFKEQFDAEEEVFNTPGYWELCESEQERRLAPVYASWNHTNLLPRVLIDTVTYSHVKEDLEAGIKRIYLHIEAEITKGKYQGYDTFLGPEAVYYLKLYIEQRRKGTDKMPPETIIDDSPH